MSDAPDFEIFADERNKKGYSYTVCVKCQLKKEIGGDEFVSKRIQVKGEADCSIALESLDTKNIPTIVYNKK